MPAFLTRLRRNEPLRLVMWPCLGAVAVYLVARGLISNDLSSLITAVGVAILGGPGVAAVRAQVTPAAHLPAAIAAGTREAVGKVRGQVGEDMGQPGLDALAYIDGLVQTVATQRPGRHERGTDTAP